MSLKKLTSLTIAFSFIVMSWTGIVLYFVPRGKVAYWTNWKFMGLTKEQYGEIHTTMMILFVLATCLHIYYNWKPLVSYLKDKTHKISFTKKEFVVAMVLNLAFVFGTIFMVQPFKGVIGVQDDIKDYWTETYGEPPYGHAEESSLKSFCKKVGINYESAIKALNAKGIKFDEKDDLKTIAKKNGISPQDIYNIISKNKESKESKESKASGGSSNIPAQLGRKSFEDLGKMDKIDLEKSLNYLKSKGVKDVSKETQLKDVAFGIGTTPVELYKELVELSKK